MSIICKYFANAGPPIPVQIALKAVNIAFCSAHSASNPTRHGNVFSLSFSFSCEAMSLLLCEA